MKFAVAGATGKMGKMLIETILRSPNAQLTGALEHPASPLLGTDAGAFLGQQTNVLITDDLAKGLAGAEYLIDFTRPEGTLLHLEAAKRAGVKMIVGTTG
ncbi:MAG: 4-hydroxy-tetrahydrodipicolinate reductase, partial [Burkholderiaceae bacterium]|nr:4-hydroxy-tetrahydrodipicolinate reductase [Burkholderiaceae bacterium]